MKHLQQQAIMHRYILIFFLGFILSFPGQARGQNLSNIRFEHITSEDDLSSSTVNAILQDSEGFMWFGTNDGLNRYDGYEMRVYKPDPDDPGSISDAHITTIFEDDNSTLWIGTSNAGLNRYNRDQDNFISIQSDPVNPASSISDNTIRAIIKDHAGRIWIGTYTGLNWYIPEEDRFVHFYPDSTNEHSLSSSNITALARDTLGQIWVGTENGLNRWNPEEGNFTRFFHDPSNPNSISSNYIWDIYRDSNGMLWIGTKGGGLNYYNREENRFYSYTHDPEDPYSIADNSVYEIFEDSRGVFWVGGETNGLDIFDRREKRFYHFKHGAGDPHSITNNSIHKIYENRDQILWLGTFTGGINYTDRKYSIFEHYRHNPAEKNPLSNNSVVSFLEDSKGNFWVGTDGGGLNLFDRQHKSFKTLRHQANNSNSLSSDVILDMLEDKDGDIWLGYYGGGISEFNPEDNSFTHYRHIRGDTTSISNDDVFVLHEDRENNLWVGTNGGDLNLFQQESGTFRQYTTSIDIRALHDDVEGFVWVGTYGAGLVRLTPENGETLSYNKINSSIQSDIILVIHEGDNSTLWLGTHDGLIKFDRKARTFVQYTVKDGLPSMVINGILEDRLGHLWLSTNNGLSRFIPETGEFKNFGPSYDLQSREYNPLSYYKDDRGFMYFGGVNGFNRFHPDSVRTREHVAPVKITGFQIFNEPVTVGSHSPLTKQITQTDKIVLPHSASVFTFQYSTLNFNKIKGDQFAYMMEGFDGKWNQVGTKRTATYTNLDPGEYQFKVKAANRDGIWGTNTASLNLVITPPFWQTTWFYLLSAIAIGGSVFGGYQYRMRKIRAQNRYLEQEVNSRTKELYKKNKDLEAAMTELQQTRDELVEKAHKAGMADIASGVLHNVGNILNSVNTSASVIEDTVKQSKVKGLEHANGILREHIDRIETFIAEDPKGKQLLQYYMKLEEPLKSEQVRILQQSERLNDKINLIKQVIAAQQSYAGAQMDSNHLSLAELIDDALTLNAGSINRHKLQVVKDLKPVDPIIAERAKLVHILINLLKNAKEAMAGIPAGDKKITIKTWQDTKHVYLSITDNGEGIKKEHLGKIFTHGFTTKKNGHGFGLHSSANYMSEMKGKISAHSEGEGKGTTFTLNFTKNKSKEAKSKNSLPTTPADLQSVDS